MKMKIKFTQEEMNAIEAAYYDNEGTIPCDVSHTSQEKAYQILQQLWLKMAEKIGEKIAKDKAKREAAANAAQEGGE